MPPKRADRGFGGGKPRDDLPGGGDGSPPGSGRRRSGKNVPIIVDFSGSSHSGKKKSKKAIRREQAAAAALAIDGGGEQGGGGGGGRGGGRRGGGDGDRGGGRRGGRGRGRGGGGNVVVEDVVEEEEEEVEVEEDGEAANFSVPVDNNEGKGEKGKSKQSTKSRKEAKWKGLGDYVPYLDPANLPVDPKVAALGLYELYESAVEVVTSNFVRQKIQDIPMLSLSSNATPEDLIKYSIETEQLYLDTCPFAIPVMMNGVTKPVPVTPAKPTEFEDTSHHIVVLKGEIDEPEVHLLIEQFSNYLKALKIVIPGEVDNKPWLSLAAKKGVVNLLPRRFKKVRHIKYEEGYGSVEKVSLHKGKLKEVYKFFLTFDVPDPENIEQTGEGKILCWTSFVCFCELNRLGVVKEWALDGVTRELERPSWLPDGYSTLLTNWSYLCKLIFMLYLAFLEKAMMDELSEDEKATSPDFNESKVLAYLAWKERQKVIKAIQFFFEPEDRTTMAPPKLKIRRKT